MKKFLTILLTAALLLQLTAGLCFAQEKEVVSLPAESKTWNYTVNNGETTVSDFTFTPTAVMTGLKLSYTTTAESHSLAITIRNVNTNEAVYTNYVRVLKDALQENHIGYMYFETGQTYEIEIYLSNALYDYTTNGTITCSANASALFSDVPAENEALYAAVKQLQALDIVDVPTDGMFHPEANITRGEMAYFLTGLYNARNTPGTSVNYDPFADVSCTHYYASCIKFAKGMGIMLGYGDDTFRPDQNITYAEVVKTLIGRLGYWYHADAYDVPLYPEGYLLSAKEIGLTKNVTITDPNAPATKGDIALMMHNALTIPLMERLSYSNPPRYDLCDGKDGRPYRTILNSKF